MSDALKKLLSQAVLADDATTFLDHDKNSRSWMDAATDGQLAIDVYHDEKSIIIEAPIAGVDPDDLDVAIQHDMVTIRGKRTHQHQPKDDAYFSRECYWGAFSRTIILPGDVRADDAEAVMKHGILTITLPKATINTTLKIQHHD
jgi:HSP20 family protein